ncbi:MAG: hypothetical protein ACOCP4_02695 [Candidatus Woesearchaeota archaeon]
MKPKIVHNQAMEKSLEAKEALIEGRYSDAFELYKDAADLESKVADFYLSRSDLEPTRSLIIRSAAFLNLKSGNIDNAQRFILFGLLNLKDKLIKKQLDDALELLVSLKNIPDNQYSNEYNYINLLRFRSVHYTIEPIEPTFGSSITLETIQDFSSQYLKSIKAYARSKYKKIKDVDEELEDSIKKELDKRINPLITSSAYGSFRFSIANDFVAREGEENELVKLKSNIVSFYHNEIFTNPLTDNEIEKIKNSYSESDIDAIFRPLSKIKSNRNPYKIGYYDSESMDKRYVKKIVNNQRRKLFPSKEISQKDIGELESLIKHKRRSKDGTITKKTIIREELKTYEYDLKISKIEPRDKPLIILSEEILINIHFDSQTGFKFTFEDLEIEHSSSEFHKGLEEFYSKFYEKIMTLANKENKTEKEQREWEVVKGLINNPDALKTE